MIPYRNLTENTRHFSTRVQYRHTDMLLAGNNPAFADAANATRARLQLALLYQKLEAHMASVPDFRHSLCPVDSQSCEPVVRDMTRAAKMADVGPMAAVAGAFADHVLNEFEDDNHSFFVENGGDLALRCVKPTKFRIYTGWKEENIGVSLILPKGRYGVASSSGRYGHSLSLGTADMVTAVASTGAVADAFATAVANQIELGSDLQKLADDMPGSLLALAIVHDGRFAYRGPFELDFA